MDIDDLKTFSENAENEVQNEVQTITKEEPKLSAAEKMYSRHLTNVKRYQHKNPEKMKLKAKRYMENLKKDTGKYILFLEKRRNYYLDVIKPKKEKKLEEAHEALPTTLVI
tara:strand:- start:113 stop:445 length:333 start_codon:yes stop_codon:yes gene_type:complete